MSSEKEILERLKASVAAGEEETAERLAKEALSKIKPTKILEAASAGMAVMAEKYSRNEVFLPEATVTTAAFYKAFEVVQPAMKEAAPPKLGKVVIGSGFGDVHDVGKNLVKVMLEAAGFEIYDLGRNVTAEQFLNKAMEIKADIVAISALYTPTVVDIRRFVKLLDEKGVRGKFKVMIGGGSTSPAIAESLGITYGKDLHDAVLKAKALVGR